MLIKTKNGFFTVSNHAIAELIDEDISEDEIRQTLEDGQIEESNSSGENVYIHRRIKVAVVVNDADNIITIYRIK